VTAIDPAELENRLRYHVPDEERAKKHEELRAAYGDLARRMNEILPPCREAEVAFQHLVDFSLWAANAALARRSKE
jgi:hypothetical protein